MLYDRLTAGSSVALASCVGSRILKLMVEPTDDEDLEVTAIATISRVLARLEDAEARKRVISYVLARYVGTNISTVMPSNNTLSPTIPTQASGSAVSETSSREIAGIARVTESGELRITIRDLKARSGLDAAVRLAHVAIYAHVVLLGIPMSSAKGLTPILKMWRLYDGNTRTRLAREKGIVRSGDDLALDAHATRDAQRFIEEILDPNVEGSWRPR